MEFLFVEYPDTCSVILNGIAGAWTTNQVLVLAPGHYSITLSLDEGLFRPTEIDLTLTGTNVFEPKTVTFVKS